MKQVLIIGASTGIGYGLVTKFINNDYHVFAVSRNISSIPDSYAKNVTIIQADITNPVYQTKIINQIVAIEDIEIINSAAIGIPQPFQNSTPTELRNHFETNFFAPIQLLKSILDQNRVTKVLNISSGAAEFPVENLFSYCTSKAAMSHAIKCFNLEYPKTKFSNLRPGMVDTPLQDRWRKLDASIFPDGNPYVQAKKNNQLIAVSTVADFVYWVMNQEQFKDTWNIYDEDHHKHWLRSMITMKKG